MGFKNMYGLLCSLLSSCWMGFPAAVRVGGLPRASGGLVLRQHRGGPPRGLAGQAARVQSGPAQVGIRPFLSLALWPTEQLSAATG